MRLVVQRRVDVRLQVLEDPRDGGTQRRRHARAVDRRRLDHRRGAGMEVTAHVVDRVDVRQVALVVLEHQRDFVRIDAVEPQVGPEVLQALHIRLAHRRLRVGHEHHAVRPAQDQLARRVVEHLAGNGVELHADFLTGDRAQLHRHEVEEQRAVRLRRHGDHLALVLQLRIPIDLLEVRRLPAQAGAVVHQLDGDLVDRLVDEDHAPAPPTGRDDSMTG